MINFEDINITYSKFRSGVKYITVPMPESCDRNALKDRKRIDGSSITRTRVLAGLWRYSGKVDDSRNTAFEFFMVNKAIGKSRLMHCFATEKEALRSVDMFFIREGREPKYTLKKND